MLALGDKVQDSLTHYQGVVVAITDWLYGGREVAVQAEELKNGRPRRPHWFDVNRLIKTRDKRTGRKRAAA